MSDIRRREHLDASGDREVVYCHACENEWYKDQQDLQQGLECPACDGVFTEIVTRDNDPRSQRAWRHSRSRNGHRLGGSGDDSDPDEPSIDDFRNDQNEQFPFLGLFSPQRQDGRSERDPPDNGEDIIRHFTETLMQGMNYPPRSPDREGAGPGNRPGDRPGEPDYHFHTIRTTGPFGGGRATVTITSSRPMQQNPGGAFDAFFGEMVGANGREAGGGRPGPRMNLHELLQGILNPVNAVHGDAAYSQEALDQVITQFMEARPQTNAAPPASQQAIERLQKKKVDDALLASEGRAECTICIDELNKGDEVAVLPCNHWFHSACVTLWLKEHNTCPVCRAPIESGVANQSSTDNAHSTSNPVQRSTPMSASPSASRNTNSAAYWEGRLRRIRDNANSDLDTVQPSAPPGPSSSAGQASRTPPDGNGVVSMADINTGVEGNWTETRSSLSGAQEIPWASSSSPSQPYVAFDHHGDRNNRTSHAPPRPIRPDSSQSVPRINSSHSMQESQDGHPQNHYQGQSSRRASNPNNNSQGTGNRLSAWLRNPLFRDHRSGGSGPGGGGSRRS